MHPLATRPALYLDERADRAIAALTRRLAHAARRTFVPHDFLLPLLDPDLLEPPAAQPPDQTVDHSLQQ